MQTNKIPFSIFAMALRRPDFAKSFFFAGLILS
jgi:hypothetical protein